MGKHERKGTNGRQLFYEVLARIVVELAIDLLRLVLEVLQFSLELLIPL